MKRIVFALLALVMIITLVSCAGAEETAIATKTEETTTEDIVAEAINDFSNKIIYASWQLEYMKNDSIEYNHTEKDLDLIEACKKWSQRELAAFIAEILAENSNNHSYDTLCSVTAQHGFDGPFVAIVKLMAEDYIRIDEKGNIYVG